MQIKHQTSELYTEGYGAPRMEASKFTVPQPGLLEEGATPRSSFIIPGRAATQDWSVKLPLPPTAARARAGDKAVNPRD